MSTQPTLKSWSIIIPAVRRFVVLADLNNQAVLDRETGLVWEKTPDTTQNNWSVAIGLSIDKNVGGRKGWRLPSVVELSSLVDPSVFKPGPTLPPGHPFLNIGSGEYWSATTLAGDPSIAWRVDFTNGGVGYANKVIGGYMWCVRGGMNADAY